MRAGALRARKKGLNISNQPLDSSGVGLCTAGVGMGPLSGGCGAAAIAGAAT
jgi:hypothetical protein